MLSISSASENSIEIFTKRSHPAALCIPPNSRPDPVCLSIKSCHLFHCRSWNNKDADSTVYRGRHLWCIIFSCLSVWRTINELHVEIFWETSIVSTVSGWVYFYKQHVVMQGLRNQPDSHPLVFNLIDIDRNRGVRNSDLWPINDLGIFELYQVTLWTKLFALHIQTFVALFSEF